MRKRPVKYVEAFTRGLRSSPDPKNQDRLARCYNAKPQVEGLRGWNEIPQIVEQGSVDFPFPQVFVGREQTLLVYEDTVNIFHPASGFQGRLLTYDADNPLVSMGIISGGSWHFVDLGKLFILSNGNCLVFRDNTNFDYNNLPTVKTTSTVVLSAICEWRGRIFSGGFRPNLHWKAAWEDVLEGYRGNERVPDVLRNMSYDLKENFVLWSTVGTSDLSFRWLVYPSEGLQGIDSASVTDIEGVAIDTYSGGKSPLQEAALRNEFGMMQMPFQGPPLAIVPHAQGVVVYGTEGIVLLRHEASVSTFGKVVLSREVGIAGRGAVAGNESTHCFIDSKGCLCLLNSEAKITALGYEEFFGPLLSQEIIVSLQDDIKEPEFYICTKDEGFCLTTTGLGQQYQKITSVGTFGGSVAVVSLNDRNRGMQLEISDFDGNVQGLKQASVLRLKTNKSSGLLGSSVVSYNNDRMEVTTPARAFNPEGNLVLKDTGTSLRLAISSDDPTDILIERLDAEYATLDKTFTRGPNAEEVG